MADVSLLVRVHPSSVGWALIGVRRVCNIGHEELDAVGLVHMNGRVYDPLLARFGTPDPTTESPFSTQGWNRYSYVGNSPLNFTDPSGYCFLGCFWQPIFAAIQNLFRSVPLIGSFVQIAAGVLCAGPLAPLCVGLAAAAVTGITSGKLGLALKAGFISAVTAFAMFEVGELTKHGTLTFGSETHLLNVAGHALVGCASATANGGKSGSAALSGAVGSFAGPLLSGLDFSSKLVATSVLGGLAAVAGGGKFANGALTAAFGYLFNECANSGCLHGPYDEPALPTPPPGVSLDDAVATSRQHLNPWWFYDQVKSGGEWDFKRSYGREYEDYGNFFYGVVGKAFAFGIGFTDFMLYNEAGIYQANGPNSDRAWEHRRRVGPTWQESQENTLTEMILGQIHDQPWNPVLQ